MIFATVFESQKKMSHLNLRAKIVQQIQAFEFVYQKNGQFD